MVRFWPDASLTPVNSGGAETGEIAAGYLEQGAMAGRGALAPISAYPSTGDSCRVDCALSRQVRTRCRGYASSSNSWRWIVPLRRTAASIEYSGTSSQVARSADSGSEETMIDEAAVGPPIIFHSPSWCP